MKPGVLQAECPRCASSVTETSAGWKCPDHGAVTPLWRPRASDYETFAEHVRRAGSMPTFAPWPFGPGWAITDFGCVAGPGTETRAAFLTCSGPSDLDGVVEVTVLSEEPGVGVGARCTGIARTDHGAEVGDGPPDVKVRIDGHPVPLWSVLTSDADVDFDRSVFAGEAYGRWLWLVLRPASAALLLRDEWILLDVAGLGPELMDLPFAHSPRAW
jgi:hypothetical protein